MSVVSSMNTNKKIAVLDFVKQNHRYPSELEIEALVPLTQDTLYPGASLDGDAESRTIDSFDKGLEISIRELVKEAVRLESRYKIEFAANKKVLRSLNKATSKIERFFLSKGTNSNYVPSIIDDFTNDTKLNVETSDEFVFNNGLTLPRTATTIIVSKRDYSVQGTARVTSTKGSIATISETAPLSISLEGDATTSIEFIFRLNRNQHVSDIYFKTVDIEHVWTVYDKLGRQLSNQTNYNESLLLPVNATVDYLRIVCKKLVPTQVQNFKFFAIELQDTTKVLSSTFNCGSYDVSKMNFFKFVPCQTVPEKTSIRYFAQVDDGATFPIEPESVYSLSTGVNSLATSTINEDIEADLLDHENEIDVSAYYLNSKITETIKFGRLTVRKNVYQPSTNIGTVPSGWRLNGDGDYETNLEYGQSTVIECGTTSISFNGTLLTGTVILNPGLYKVIVPSNFFYSFREGIRNAASLSNADPLYPFNGRYLIEGYDYHNSFRGTKPYKEKQYIWAETLTYAAEADSTHFTLDGESAEGDLIYSVKVLTDYKDGWKEETYAYSYRKEGNSASELNIQIVMETMELGLSPTCHYLEMEAI